MLGPTINNQYVATRGIAQAIEDLVAKYVFPARMRSYLLATWMRVKSK